MKITYLKICNYKSIEQLEITDIENALILVQIQLLHLEMIMQISE